MPSYIPSFGKLKWVKLPFAKVPDVNELMAQTKDQSIKGYYVRLALEKVGRVEVISSTLDYPGQVWNFDNKMAMINLGGEVEMDYSFRLKEEFGAEQLWINAYSIDVPVILHFSQTLTTGFRS